VQKLLSSSSIQTGQGQRIGEGAAQGGAGDLEVYRLGWKARITEERKGMLGRCSPRAEMKGNGRNSKRGGLAVDHGGRLGAPRIGMLRRTSDDGKRHSTLVSAP
jgi:hypothetical protein